MTITKVLFNNLIIYLKFIDFLISIQYNIILYGKAHACISACAFVVFLIGNCDSVVYKVHALVCTFLKGMVIS